jgi:hypothetical protein
MLSTEVDEAEWLKAVMTGAGLQKQESGYFKSHRRLCSQQSGLSTKTTLGASR